MPDYWSSDTSIEVSWDSFYSPVGMFLYYVAVSSQPVDNTTCQSYVSNCQLSPSM